MPDPRDGKCGKMPHYCPGWGGGGWALLELTDAYSKSVMINIQCSIYFTGPEVSMRDAIMSRLIIEVYAHYIILGPPF